MHCMLMDLLHGFEVLSTTEETLFNSRNNYYCTQVNPQRYILNVVIAWKLHNILPHRSGSVHQTAP